MAKAFAPAPLTIHNHTIQPGEQSVIFLPMPTLYDCTPLSMPVHVIRGKTPGPTLCITAAIHGDELNGIEIVRRLLKKITPHKIAGTIIAIPIVNIYGFLYQDRYLMDRRDLNRSFPGSSKGSLAARLAHLIATEIISKATHCVDLHSGSLHRTNLPQIRTNIDNDASFTLAKTFNAPVILHATLRDGSLRQYANEKGIPFLLYEAGESLRLDEFSIKTGLHGLLNLMQALNIITKPSSSPLKKKTTPTTTRSSYWVRSPQSGLIHSSKTIGKRIEKGELLAIIGNPTTTEEYKLYSPLSGIIIGKNNLPMVHEGAALFHIASFEKLQRVEEHIEYLHEYISDDTGDKP
ncbi:MAG: succinylglutamate desuccinylase/aspartoacylase family protein [Gammaproteobacteria bacterium]